MTRRMVVIRNQDIAIVGVGEWLPDGTWRFLDEQDAVVSTTCDRPHLSAAICWAQAVAAQHPSAQSLPPVAGDGAVEPAALRVGPRRPAPVPARIDWPVLGTWAVIGAASSAWVACIAITAHAVWKAVWG